MALINYSLFVCFRWVFNAHLYILLYCRVCVWVSNKEIASTVLRSALNRISNGFFWTLRIIKAKFLKYCIATNIYHPSHWIGEMISVIYKFTSWFRAVFDIIGWPHVHFVRFDSTDLIQTAPNHALSAKDFSDGILLEHYYNKSSSFWDLYKGLVHCWICVHPFCLNLPS